MAEGNKKYGPVEIVNFSGLGGWACAPAEMTLGQVQAEFDANNVKFFAEVFEGARKYLPPGQEPVAWEVIEVVDDDPDLVSPGGCTEDRYPSGSRRHWKYMMGALADAKRVMSGELPRDPSRYGIPVTRH